jgi:recombination protein RecA
VPREKREREREPDPPDDRNPRWTALAKTAAAFKSFRPARVVLREVRAVPTRFVQFDHGTRVGGLPVERYTLVHGGSNEGKTSYSIGVAGSFLEKDHFVHHVDAERTTSIPWVEELIGPYADHPYYTASRPDSFEETIAEVRNFLNIATDLRARRKVPPDTCALVLVDSVRKLIPKGLLDEILDLEEQELGDVSSGKDRRAQIQARMNAAWVDELTPMLEKAQAGMIAIAREMQDTEASDFAKKSGRDYKVGGGRALFFEASLVIRCERAAWIEVGQGKDRKVYGERIRALIRKTKVGGKDDRDIATYFHISNGQLIPAGFDRARDVLELAVKMGIVEQAGAHYAYAGEYITRQGVNAAVVQLTKNREWLDRIEAQVRATFKEKPARYDPETGEVTA